MKEFLVIIDNRNVESVRMKGDSLEKAMDDYNKNWGNGGKHRAVVLDHMEIKAGTPQNDVINLAKEMTVGSVEKAREVQG